MRSTLEKAFRIVISILLVFGLADNRILATAHNVSKSFMDGISYQAKKGAYTAWGQGFTLKVDGDTAFCVDPKTEITVGAGYEESDFPAKQRTTLSVIAYEGSFRHRNDGDSKNWQFATQLMIWEEMGWSITSASGINYSSYKKSIQSSVNNHRMRPSFHGKNDITLTVGEHITLTDTNKVFHNFHVVSSDGLTVKQNGDKLTITATQNASDNSTVSYNKIPAANVGTSLIYRKAGSQDIGKFFVKDPLSTAVHIKVIKTGSLRITKIDEDGTAVPDTSFQLSYHSDMSQPIGTYQTGRDGSVEVPGLDAQTVYVQEVKVPEHLVLDHTIYSIQVKSNQTTGYQAVNSIVKGTVKIRKKDQDTGSLVGSAIYGIYDAGMKEVERLVTRGDDWTVSSALRYGSYHIKEIEAPEGYVLNDQVYDVTIKKNEQSIEVNGSDRAIKGYIKVIKKDADSDKVIVIANTLFDVYSSADQKIGVIQTNGQGEVTTDLMRYGSYYLKEKTAPKGYILNDQRLRYTISEDGKTYVQTMSDKRVRGSVTVHKEDEVTGTSPQGEATLIGAVYGLYARSDITDPADGAVIYKKGSKLQSMVMDEKASAAVRDLYLGEYRIKEEQPSRGYTLDTRNYDFDLLYKDQNVDIITKQMNVKERVISQAFSIIKVSADGSSEAALLAGAEFTIKAQKDVEAKGNWEAAPVAFNASGKEAAVMVSDKQGYAVSEELSYGHYIVRETKVPADHSKTKDFEVTIDKDNRTPQPWRVFQDDTFKAVIAIVKKDIETGNTVALAGAKFKILNLDEKAYVGSWVWSPIPHYVDSWTSDKSGQVMTNNVLKPGHYQMEETEAPEGYTLNTAPVKFVVSSDVAYETLPDGMTPLITIEKSDRSVKGKIQIEKQGEQLDQITKDAQGNLQFHYANKGLRNAQFDVFAETDIFAADHSGKKLFEKNQLVEQISSNSLGKAESKELPLGRYYVKEVATPDGFAQSKEVYHAELKYEGQMKAIVFHKQTVENQRVKVDLKVHKVDEEDGNDIKGTQFGLYAVKDIMDYANKIVVKKGDLIELGLSDEKGRVIFHADLPLSEYEVKEVHASEGYVSETKVINVDARYQGAEKEMILIQETYKNRKTEVAVRKIDSENEESVKGAKLQILDQTGTVVDNWISGSNGETAGKINPHIIRGLKVGETYILQEVTPPFGYTKAADVEFVVADQRDVQGIVMKNQPNWGTLRWKKSGEVFQGYKETKGAYGTYMQPYWEMQSIEGAEITIYAKTDIVRNEKIIYHKNEKIEVLHSSLTDTESKKLPAGAYYYAETAVPEGYVQDEKQHDFMIHHDLVADLQVVSAVLKNDRLPIDLKLVKQLEKQKSFENTEAYKDVVFGIFTAKEQWKNEKLLAAEDTLVYVQGIREDGQLSVPVDLPQGSYYVKEMKTNGQYRIDDKKYPFVLDAKDANQGRIHVMIKEKGIVVNVLKRGAIQIRKSDQKSKKPVENVRFALAKDADMKDVLAVSDSDAQGIVRFDELELGTYYLQESSAAYGYVRSSDIRKVKVREDGEVINLAIENVPLLVHVLKSDEQTGKVLTGAKLALYDQDKQLITSWTSGEKAYDISYLEEGKQYTLHEVEAPVGYHKSSDITFIAQHELLVEMKDQKIEIITTGDLTNQNTWIISGVASLILCFVLLIRKKLS